MFFDGVTPALAHEARVLPSAGGARVRVGRLRFGQLIVSCASLRLVAAGDGVSALPEWSGDAEHRELRRSVSLRAAPDARARAIQIAPDASGAVLLSTIATQGAWVHVAGDLGEGARVHGWVRASEVPVSDSGQGAGGFSGRRAGAPRTSVPTFACYLGPARFPARAPLYAVENGTRPWGAVAADARLVIRDCRSGSRVQLAEALGGENLGWVDATAVHDVGVSECEGLTLAQDTRTLRVRVTASTRTDVVPGDEVVRVGSRAVYGPPFDSARRGMVSPMALRDVCSGLARERVVLDRGGRRVVLAEPVPMP